MKLFSSRKVHPEFRAEFRNSAFYSRPMISPPNIFLVPIVAKLFTIIILSVTEPAKVQHLILTKSTFTPLLLAIQKVGKPKDTPVTEISPY